MTKQSPGGTNNVRRVNISIASRTCSYLAHSSCVPVWNTSQIWGSDTQVIFEEGYPHKGFCSVRNQGGFTGHHLGRTKEKPLAKDSANKAEDDIDGDMPEGWVGRCPR